MLSYHWVTATTLACCASHHVDREQNRVGVLPVHALLFTDKPVTAMIWPIQMFHCCIPMLSSMMTLLVNIYVAAKNFKIYLASKYIFKTSSYICQCFYRNGVCRLAVQTARKSGFKSAKKRQHGLI